MAKFNSGYATVDHAMQIKKADDVFYKYVGEDSFFTLAQSAHPDDLRRLNVSIGNLKNNGYDFITYRIRRFDGKYRWFLAEMEYEPIEYEGENLITISFQDILDLDREIKELKDKNQEYGEFFGLLDEVMFTYDIEADELRIYMGGGKQETVLYVGTLQQWVLDIKQKGSIADADMSVFEALCENIRSGARSFKHELLSSEFSVNNEKERHLIKGKTLMNSQRERHVVGCIMVLSSDSKKKDIVNIVEYNKDAATDILNKKAITNYAKNCIESRPGKEFTLCIVDLDNFKEINDTLGHMFGDEVLATVAGILKEAVGNKGMVGRIGGDEMMLVLENMEDYSELRSILRTIRTNVEWAYKGKIGNISLTASMGVAAYPNDTKDYDSLFKIADKMLYFAKKKGKNRYVIYTREIHGDILEGGEISESKTSIAFGQDKEGLVLKLTEKMLSKRVITYDDAMAEILTTFGLDEINLYFDYEPKHPWKWIIGEVSEEDKVLRNTDYIYKDMFEEMFDAKGMAVIDSTPMILGKYDKAYQYFTKIGATAVLIYQFKVDDRQGYIVYMRKSTSSRKWEDKDKAYLTFIGQIFALTIGAES